MKSLIIDTPSLQSLRQKYTYAVLTLLFWLVWFYLWLPLVSLLAWLFGIDVFYEHMIVLEGLKGLLELLGWYAMVIALIGCILVIWSSYNLLRFGGKNKRTHNPPVRLDEIASCYALEPAALVAAREAKTLTIQQDEQGSIKIIHSAGTAQN